jgi:biofilm PGA synthesis N-glycosyltransferase PgaC
MRELTSTRYALITPVRDEQDYIGGMIESMLAQTVLPAKWIIVDDGSADKTPEIIQSYIPDNPFLQLLRLSRNERRAPGGEGAIGHALRQLAIADYEFLARFDADLLFEPNYIESILSEFQRDPRLGIAGGGLYIKQGTRLKPEKVPEYHVRGALKMYRRECFEQIGGITTQIGWDTIDEVYAWTKGWRTKSFFNYRVIHRRPTGEGISAGRIYFQRGKAEYYTWSAPLFVIAKCAKLMAEHRSLAKPLMFFTGFASGYLNRDPRLQDVAFRRTRRIQQLGRLCSAMIPFDRRGPSDGTQILRVSAAETKAARRS